MRLLVDLRCQQMPGGIAPSVLATTAALLRQARTAWPELTERVGLIDDSFPDPPRDGIERLQLARTATGEPSVFLQPAPLAHDCDTLGGLIRRPRGFNCVLVADLPAAEFMPTFATPLLARLAWLPHFHTFGCLTAEDRTRLGGYATPHSLNAITLADTNPDDAADRFWRHARSRWLAVGSTARRPVRPRLAWLTAYPPDHAGSTEYGVECLKALAEFAEVDVFVEGKSPQNEPRRDSWVREYKPLDRWPYLSGEYDAIVAVLANNSLHIPVLELHAHLGGPCLLHEPHLAELYTLHHGPEAARQLAERCVGRTVTADEFQTWLVEPHRLTTLLLDDLLPRAEPLLVHGDVYDLFCRQYPSEALERVEVIPFLCPRRFRPADLTPQARRAARQRLNIPEGRILLVSLGTLHPAKAPLECMWVTEQLLAWGVDVELCFAGAGYFLQHTLEPWVGRMRLEGRVHFHTHWLDDNLYRDHLIAADYALLLRSRGPGSLSEAVLDCIDADLPAVVTARLAATMEAGNLLITVGDAVSPLLVAERLLDAIAAGLHHSRLGSARKAYRNAHSPARFASGLFRALRIA
jgi:hypothetical protein